MLVTTGKAEGQTVKLGGETLTFYFPTSEIPPEVTVKNDVAIVGEQKVTIKNGNLELTVTGE